MTKVPIKISIKTMTHQFAPCDLGYIEKYCHGRCCLSKDVEIMFDRKSVPYIESLGYKLTGNYMVCKDRCPFFLDGLCKLHTTGHKPYICQIAPFTLNKNRVLYIRRHAYMLPCYLQVKHGIVGGIPLYIAQKDALVDVIGKENWVGLEDYIKKGNIENWTCFIPEDRYLKIVTAGVISEKTQKYLLSAYPVVEV